MTDERKSRSGIRDIAELVSFAIAAIHIIGAFRGKEPPEDAPDEVKIAARAIKGGVRGVGDEVAYIEAIRKLDPKDQKLLEEFVRWHFSSVIGKNSRIRAAVSIWYANQWRVALMSLNSPTRERGTRKTVTKTNWNIPQDAVRAAEEANEPKGPSFLSYSSEETEDEKLYSPGTDGAVEFLKELISIIQKGRTREAGFEAAEQHLRYVGFPTMPNETVAWWERQLDRFPNIISDSLEEWSRNYQDDADDRLDNLGFMSKLIRRIQN